MTESRLDRFVISSTTPSILESLRVPMAHDMPTPRFGRIRMPLNEPMSTLAESTGRWGLPRARLQWVTASMATTQND